MIPNACSAAVASVHDALAGRAAFPRPNTHDSNEVQMPDRSSAPPLRRLLSLAAVAAAMLAWSGTGAWAQGFSSKEGYGPDGGYQLFVELSPYAFLPHVDATANGLGPRGIRGTSGSVSGWKLLSSLQGAFFGNGIVRYGPFSAELNAIYVNLKNDRIYTLPRLGRNVTGDASMDMTLVQAGVGYRVYSGNVAGMDSGLDARVGAQYLSWNAHANTASNLLGGADASGEAASPYLGVRADLYPTPKWRIRFASDVSGFGVNNNTWGWQAALTGSYLVRSWFDVTAGFAVYDMAANRDVTSVLGSSNRQTLHVLAYGPMIGIGFRF